MQRAIINQKDKEIKRLTDEYTEVKEAVRMQDKEMKEKKNKQDKEIQRLNEAINQMKEN